MQICMRWPRWVSILKYSVFIYLLKTLLHQLSMQWIRKHSFLIITYTYVKLRFTLCDNVKIDMARTTFRYGSIAVVDLEFLLLA